MLKKVFLGIGFAALAITLAAGFFFYSFRGAGDDPTFFEGEIQIFEKLDVGSPPAPGAIVFVGSSSIRFWSSLEDDMDPLYVLNRGFGGAHMSHVVYNAPRIILPYSPRAVVVYAGDNDIAAGKTAEKVVEDFRTLTRIVWDALPQTRIYFLPIKPSTLRFELWPEMSKANREIADWAANESRLETIDVASVLLQADGQPRPDVFRFDGLHLNAKGYALWAEVVAPVLKRAYDDSMGTNASKAAVLREPRVYSAPIQ